jgi:membrane protease YdiL (CAAX protease family)
VLAPSDWLLLATLAVAMPAYSYARRNWLARAAAQNRRAIYLRTMAMLWLIALACLFAWWKHGRPFEALGFLLPGGMVTTASGWVVAMIVAAIALRARTLARWTPEKCVAMRERIGGTEMVLPHTAAELYWFFGVALTAGICEEVLYRGYVMAVAAPFVTVYGAIAVSAAIFGLGHFYQGLRGVAATAAIGAFLGAFYFFSGSLLWPILLHVLIDVNGGVTGYLLYRERKE